MPVGWVVLSVKTACCRREAEITSKLFSASIIGTAYPGWSAPIIRPCPLGFNPRRQIGSPGQPTSLEDGLDAMPRPMTPGTHVLAQAGTRLRQWLFRGSVWAFVGRISFGLFVILQNAVLARLFPPDELGIYVLFQSLVLPIVLIAVFGTDMLVVRSIGELQSRDRLEQVSDTLRDCGLVVCMMGLVGAGVLIATLL